MEYKRILLKLSGEALGGKTGTYSKEVLDDLLKQIKTIKEKDIEIGIVIGGGNLFRGALSSKLGLGEDTAPADYMGMTATIINAFALRIILNNAGMDAVVQNVLDYEFIKKDLNPDQAKKDLSNGKIVIFAGGTGQPYVSTDSAAAERAIEIEADVILSAKNGVEGAYDSDPKINPNAEFISNISFKEVLEKKLKVIDEEAMKLLLDKNIDIILFNMNTSNNIVNVIENPETKKTTIGRK